MIGLQVQWARQTEITPLTQGVGFWQVLFFKGKITSFLKLYEFQKTYNQKINAKTGG
jgi:hypothetical protein